MAGVIIDAQQHRADEQEQDRDDLERHEGDTEDHDRGGDRDHGIRGGEAAHDGRSAGFHRTEPEPRTEATAHAARDAKENATRGESGPSGPEEEPGRVDRRTTQGVQDEHPG